MGGPTAVTAESAVKAVGPPITVFSLIRAARRSCGGNTVNTWTPRIHPIMATPTSTRLCSLCSRRRRHASCCCCLVPRCGVCGLDKEPETWHGVLPADSADVPAGAWLSYCTLSCGWAGWQRPCGTALKGIDKEFQQLVIRRYLEKSIEKKLFCHLQSLQIKTIFQEKAFAVQLIGSCDTVLVVLELKWAVMWHPLNVNSDSTELR